jgi:hypothetical protein
VSNKHVNLELYCFHLPCAVYLKRFLKHKPANKTSHTNLKTKILCACWILVP